VRSLFLLIAAATLSAEAPAPADLQRFEHGLTTFDLPQARAVVDKLIHERVPSDGKPRLDPLLNGMIGQLYLLARQPALAAIYLDHAPVAELPPLIRAATAYDHGRTLDLQGDHTAALQAYREAAAASDSDDQRRRANIRIANDLLPQDPAIVRKELLPIANGPPEPERWEARYLLAISSSLVGDGASALQWADQAWADAPTAPLEDLASLRVQMLRAGLAAAANDTATERAMLTAANGLAATVTSSLSSQLPVCGDSGLSPSDFVIFGFASGPFQIRQLVPIAASRPSAVLPFEAALASTSPITQNNGDTPVCTVFTVRCRTVVSPFFLAKQPSADPLTEWAVEHGLYLASAFDESDDQHLSAVQKWIDALSSRFGPESPLLVMPRWQLLTIMQERAFAGDSVLPGEVTALRNQVVSGLRRAGAPEWLASTVEAPTQFEQLAKVRGGSPSHGDQEMETLFRKQFTQMPFDFARTALAGMLTNLHDDWPAPVARLVLDLNAKAPPSLSGRDRQAWQFLVADAQRSLGQDVEARATLLAAGISDEICAANDSEPKLVEQHFSYDDYPSALIVGSQEGAVEFEYGLSPTGTPANPRIIYSLPAGLFDQVSSRGLATIQYKAPSRGGTAVSCQGLTQPIKWQLENSSDMSPPILTGGLTE